MTTGAVALSNMSRVKSGNVDQCPSHYLFLMFASHIVYLCYFCVGITFNMHETDAQPNTETSGCVNNDTVYSDNVCKRYLYQIPKLQKYMIKYDTLLSQTIFT